MAFQCSSLPTLKSLFAASLLLLVLSACNQESNTLKTSKFTRTEDVGVTPSESPTDSSSPTAKRVGHAPLRTSSGIPALTNEGDGTAADPATVAPAETHPVPAHSVAASPAAVNPAAHPVAQTSASLKESSLDSQLHELYQKKLSAEDSPSEEVFKIALKSYCKLKETSLGEKVVSTRFAFMDLTPNSSLPRLFIYDLQNQTWSLKTKASHGGGSSLSLVLKEKRKLLANEGDWENASFFSNTLNSNMSSVGMARVGTDVFYAARKYVESNALTLTGLDDQLNDQLIKREMIVHGADFDLSDLRGQTPVSEGCTMVRRDELDETLRLLGGAAILFYHERMNDAANERVYLEQMNRYQNLKDRFTELGASGKAFAMLDSKVLTPIKSTYEYFKNKSKYANQKLDSETACLSRLGLNSALSD